MNENYHIDPLERKILEVLQEDCRLSNQEVADKVGSSPSSVWRRIKSMEESGIITGFRLEVMPEKIGLSETILLQVSLQQHTEKNTNAFNRFIETTPEVLECYATTGEHDYMLKVLAKDMRAYHRFLQERLLSQSFISKAYSVVVMQKIKDQKAIPAKLMEKG